MSLKNTKTWSRVLVPVLLLCCVSYYYSHFFLQSSERAFSKALCDSWNISQKWERLNFNVSRNAQLFLKLEDFFWRRYLSTSALPYGVKGSELFLMKALAAMASYDMPETIKHLPCKTCMVVGNGFAIKNTSLGSAINKYDIVIRLNDAPVRGYEDDVGNKTTMRLFYPESASYNPSIHNDPDTLMVLVPFKQQDVRWLKEILYNEKRIRKGFWKPPPEIWLGKTSHIRILDPYFLQQTASRLLRLPLNTPPKTNQIPTHPTTGILAIYVALNYCDVIHIAGFGYPESEDLKHPIHYYGYDTMKSMKLRSCPISATPLRTPECRRSRAMRPPKHDPAKPHCFFTHCSLNPDATMCRRKHCLAGDRLFLNNSFY
ncbi:CMP-N-acetylneuraminate-beta-galactosamide-alpha-2,3-sialyltransferase 4 isoform X1 [Oncorhynchus mykiss]|uniref:CMP-N-acetylneuraminate-beta-galactosamide- alpha-2,3-sialyltransferase 4 isoform X1 n=2 Tax=Oncorhynchus mykiss TaxID=8022 RepID=UPI0018786667|nr:CMP-N-acetylneuraminate-beta-galactosamide-alpha-2,3-sialyltransferase 4 isoform X1 [Oncorhynchus mykiss]XP_021473292.2 CMP-N-acetylneuraminate-beta-galactosamide-alpha-2,3-sialyltransferase 4 isoform X1 [Oncorhynchus mykiss]XP_021473293.2 CMP-N-acetylneuraminate-beta-galactosamide-alpha-2,3-sialyltransferase 4 isoform X1 [Oncorhynchus mykiss]XP_036845705.1 CMP-N-acetylneuraminate-beta-galactosamide-alpha-2,3-sialyltransferase 4 isoform X1 [Oncorhynchus mykiss]